MSESQRDINEKQLQDMLRQISMEQKKARETKSINKSNHTRQTDQHLEVKEGTKPNGLRPYELGFHRPGHRRTDRPLSAGEKMQPTSHPTTSSMSAAQVNAAIF